MDKDEILQKSTFMLKRILYALNQMNIKDINYLVSDNLYNKLNGIMEESNNKQEICHYENIKITPSLNREYEDEEYNYLEILFNCNCLRYITSSISNEVISGDNTNKINFVIKGIVKKDKKAIPQPSYKCEGCGTSYDVFDNSICPNCGNTYDLKKYDYIMDDLNI